MGTELAPIGGFENALARDWATRMRETRDEAARWAELPRGTFNDVGRYPIVFSGAAWGSAVGQTLIRALDGDMAAGLERDTLGSTFLRPAADFLGAPSPLLSPLLTVTSGRALPSITAVGWDDDGVVPEAYTLVDRGRIVDYCTTRDTAPMLAEWYARQGRPLRSHGNAVAMTPATTPIGGYGHVTVQPSASRVGIEDLLREMGRGFYIVDGSTEDGPNFSSGVTTGRLIVEILGGVPVSTAIIEAQLATKLALGAKLKALGDASTVGMTQIIARKGVPWQIVPTPVSAPAALCADVALKGYA